MATILSTDIVVTIDATFCGACGIHFGIDRIYLTELRSSGKSFWCPAGHCLHFTERTETKLRREIEQKERAAQAARERAESEQRMRLRAEKQNDYSRRLVTRRTNELKRARIKAVLGKCPCCSVQFADVQKHMAEAHPEVKSQLRDEFKFMDKDNSHEAA